MKMKQMVLMMLLICLVLFMEQILREISYQILKSMMELKLNVLLLILQSLEVEKMILHELLMVDM